MKTITLCSKGYCQNPPKYLVNNVLSSHTFGFQLLCGRCLRTSKERLTWQTYEEHNSPYKLDIQHDEYIEGIEIKYYKLKKHDLLWLI